MRAGAVAKLGMAVKMGEKRMANRNSRPVVTEARPVLAPAATPAVDSTNVVVVEVPRMAPADVAMESASKAGLIRGSMPFSSSISDFVATPISVPSVSKTSTNRKAKTTTMKSMILTD